MRTDAALAALLLLASTSPGTERADQWRQRADQGDLLAVLTEMRAARDLEPGEQDLEVELRERFGDFRGAIGVLVAMPAEARQSPDRIRKRAHLLWSDGEYGAARALLLELGAGESELAATARAEAEGLRETVESLDELRRERTRLRWITGICGGAVILGLGAAARDSLRARV